MTLQISAFTASGFVTKVPMGSKSIDTWSRIESRPFTQEEDKFILSARKKNRKWRQIAASLNRKLGSVYGRYARLMWG